MIIFSISIIALNKVNDIYIINVVWKYQNVRKNLFRKYIQFRIQRLNYQSSNFDRGNSKFVNVRHNDFGTFIISYKIIKNIQFEFN